MNEIPSIVTPYHPPQKNTLQSLKLASKTWPGINPKSSQMLVGATGHHQQRRSTCVGKRNVENDLG
jgi:hypothetical protein